MNDMHEAVALPDPAVKRLLHPTDLPEARELYRRGWWFGRLGSVPVAVAIAAVVWAIGGGLLGTIAAAVSTFVIGFAASRWFTSRAWDFIPRKRRDEEGAPAWRLLAAAIDAAALLVTAAAVILAIGNRPVADGVIAFAAGSGIGVAVIQAGELIVGSTRGDHGLLTARRLILLIAVAAASASLGVLGLEGDWGRDAFAAAGMGLATILVAQGLWWAVDRSNLRRVRTEDEE